MIQPLSEMENRLSIDASAPDGLQMVPFDEREPARSPRDIMARRLKNRERQRRYRARKRQEADLKKACAVQSPSSSHPQLKTQVNAAIGISNDFVSRIHCRRDWKKDARRAHLFKEPQVTPIPNSTPASGSQVPSLNFGLNTPTQLPIIMDKAETHSSTPSRRNWKAEARNKKD